MEHKEEYMGFRYTPLLPIYLYYIITILLLFKNIYYINLN